jgi:hypothetical protein
MSIQQPPTKEVMEHRTIKDTDEIKHLEGYDPTGINAPSVNDYSNNTPLQIEIAKWQHRRLVGVTQAMRGKTWSLQPYKERLEMQIMHSGSINKSIDGRGVMLDNTTVAITTPTPQPKQPSWRQRHFPGSSKQQGAPQQ